MKNVLILVNKKEQWDIGYIDALTISAMFKSIGFIAEIKSYAEIFSELDDYNFGDYETVAFSAPYNAMFLSSKRNFAIYKKVYAEAKDIVIYFCDFTFTIDPNLWGADRKTEKYNLFASRPVKLLMSFSDDIKDDEAAMLIIKNRAISKLHPDSKAYFVEWLTFNYAAFEARRFIENSEDLIKKAVSVLPQVDEIDKFYYGIDKKKLMPSLNKLGLTSGENNAVLGKIVKLCEGQKEVAGFKNEDFPEWLPHAAISKNVLFPYEPIKGEYQVTLRCLESLMYYKDKVAIDSDVSDYVSSFCLAREPWIKAMSRNTEKLKGIFNV